MGFRHKIQPMSYRAAILISCLKDEADYIREQARADPGRSISNYMLKVLLRRVELEERLYMDLSGYGSERSFARQVLLPKGPTTAIMILDHIAHPPSVSISHSSARRPGHRGSCLSLARTIRRKSSLTGLSIGAQARG